MSAVKDGGSFREMTGLNVKDGGSWREITSGNIKDGGSWREFFAPSAGGANVPAGTIFLYLGNSAPTGYSICNGASYNTSTYSQLHANIGGNFGSGNLPSLNGLYLQHNNGASGTNTGWVMKQHYHGTITAGNNNQQCRPGADPGSSNSIGNSPAFTSYEGANAAAPMNRDFLPIIAMADAAVPAGALVFTANQDSFYTDTRTQLVPADNSSLSQSTYSTLYAVVGTSYGGGGSTFNVPDVRGMFMKCNTGFSKPGTTTTNTNFPSHRHGPFFNCTQNSVSRLDTNGNSCKGTNTSGFNTSSASQSPGNENRPSNVAFHCYVATEEVGIAQGEVIICGFNDSTKTVGSAVFYEFNGQTFTGSSDIQASIESGFKSGSTIQAFDCDGRYLRATDRGRGQDPDQSNRSHLSNYSSSTGGNIAGTGQNFAFTSHSHSYQATPCNSGDPYWGNHSQRPNCQTPKGTYNNLGVNSNVANAGNTMEYPHGNITLYLVGT